MEKAPQPAYLVTAHPETTRLPPVKDRVFIPQTAKDVLYMLALVAVYFVTGKLGLQLAYVNSSTSADCVPMIVSPSPARADSTASKTTAAGAPPPAPPPPRVAAVHGRMDHPALSADQLDAKIIAQRPTATSVPLKPNNSLDIVAQVPAKPQQHIAILEIVVELVA